MIIYPAIDLCDGKCVRLYQGDFNIPTVYSDNPHDILKQFVASGSKWVHMVDLDGAKAQKLAQLDLIAKLAASTSLRIEVGGGIRTSDDVDQLFNAGVDRVVVGSICVSNPQLVKEWINDYGKERIILALDCSLDNNGIPKVYINGWQKESSFSVFEVLANYPEAKYILCTDIGVDGTFAGPTIALYRQIQLRYPKLHLIASGGVGKLADITALSKLKLHGIVIGKALYENKFTLKEARAAVRHHPHNLA